MNTIRFAVASLSGLLFLNGGVVQAASFTTSAITVTANVSLTGGPATSTFYVGPPSATNITGPTIAGTGIASIDFATNAPGAGSHLAGVSGSASLPGGSAFAGVELHDYVEVAHTSDAAPAVLEFDFTYALSALVTLAGGGGASSSYNVHITGIGDEPGESLALDLDGGGPGGFVPAVGSEFEIDETVITLGGPLSTTDSGTIRVRYTSLPVGLGGDGLNQFSIFTRASGFAIAPLVVPEPASGILWGLGALAVAFAARFRVRR